MTSAPTFQVNGQPAGKVYVYSSKTGKLLWSQTGQGSDMLGIGIEGAGDTNGGSTRKDPYEAPANRVPIAPPPLVPPGFAVATSSKGRMLGTGSGQAVYAYDKDSADKSACQVAAADVGQ